MRNLFSLLWRMLAGIATALGFAAVARKYTEPPPGQPEEGRRQTEDGRSTAPLPPAAPLPGRRPGVPEGHGAARLPT